MERNGGRVSVAEEGGPARAFLMRSQTETGHDENLV